MKVLGGQLKTYLQVTLKDCTSYEDLRESVLRYDQSTIRWTQSMALGSSISCDTAIPMEVDRVEKGKGKKGKQKVSQVQVKVSRKVKLLERRVQIAAKGTAINSRGVQSRLHGRAAHGMQLVITVRKVVSLAKVERARMVERERMALVINVDNMDTLHVTAECDQLDKMSQRRDPLATKVGQMALLGPVH